MVTPSVEEHLDKFPNAKSVVIFGVEVTWLESFVDSFFFFFFISQSSLAYSICAGQDENFP